MSLPPPPFLISEKFALTTSTHGTPLVATLKKYVRSLETLDRKAPAVILLFAHGAGFPKEIWEPTIESILRLNDRDTTPAGAANRPRIREAWAMDCQNHGEAAIVNEDVLAKNPGILNIYDYADAFSKLYTSGLLGYLDPALHKVVLIGHSAGSVGVVLATSFFNPPSMIPFSSVILVDPPMYSREMVDRQTEIYKLVEATTPLRRDIWPTQEAARTWLQARPPWGTWDPRVLDVYTKHGLRSLPTAYYPDKNNGVTLTTYKEDEHRAFLGTQHAIDALYRLNQICDFVPVHLVFGARNDLFDREVQESIINPREGRNIASVTRIKGAGHLVVQEAPDKLASALYDILKLKAPYPGYASSKL